MAHARDILLGLRFKLDLYVNYRPVKLLDEKLCPLKDKTCKQCKETFHPQRPLQSVCTLACAITQSRAKRESLEAKDARKATKEARERIKSKADWRREAQQSVNL